jgi:hypothetical protein
MGFEKGQLSVFGSQFSVGPMLERKQESQAGWPGSFSLITFGNGWFARFPNFAVCHRGKVVARVITT